MLLSKFFGNRRYGLLMNSFPLAESRLLLVHDIRNSWSGIGHHVLGKTTFLRRLRVIPLLCGSDLVPGVNVNVHQTWRFYLATRIDDLGSI